MISHGIISSMRHPQPSKLNCLKKVNRLLFRKLALFEKGQRTHYYRKLFPTNGFAFSRSCLKVFFGKYFKFILETHPLCPNVYQVIINVSNALETKGILAKPKCWDLILNQKTKKNIKRTKKQKYRNR